VIDIDPGEAHKIRSIASVVEAIACIAHAGVSGRLSKTILRANVSLKSCVSARTIRAAWSGSETVNSCRSQPRRMIMARNGANRAQSSARTFSRTIELSSPYHPCSTRETNGFWLALRLAIAPKNFLIAPAAVELGHGHWEAWTFYSALRVHSSVKGHLRVSLSRECLESQESVPRK